MPGWDYSGNGMYFITIVIQNREFILGEIIKTDDHSSVKLSDFGKIVDDEWNKSFEIRDELICDEYIIMPNHIHAIVELNSPVEAHGPHVDAHGRAHLLHGDLGESKLYRLPKSISSFIGGYKSAVNSKIDDYIDENKLDIPKYNRNNHFFQPNYHDRVIRNDNEYQRIKKYIIDNPKNWEEKKQQR